ncbi:MAG: excinuclease ABC subunit UvrA, partial [Anaerolineae bacterium]
MALDKLIVRGAREHNLKNIDVEIPRDKLVVITGLSGSGKSSLAFDTIYAEGQRRYVESLSAYARQFLGLMEKPDVDQIEGLSPAISIDQKGVSHNPRSTVGTVTEIYDYLRLLFARVGTPHCPQCGRPITQQTVQQIVDAVLELPEGTRVMVLAPLVRDRKGEHRRVFEDIRKAGYVRVRVDGEIREVDEDIELDRYKQHSIEAMVDRLVVRSPASMDPDEASDYTTRISDSVETALKLGGGLVIISRLTEDGKMEDMLFSEHFSCVHCGISLPEIEPRTFSFNTPYGACPTCDGLGSQLEFDPDLIIPDKSLTLAQGAIRPWHRYDDNGDGYYHQLLRAACEYYGIPMNVPVSELSPKQIHRLLYGGRPGETIRVHYRNRRGEERYYETTFEGVINNLQR